MTDNARYILIINWVVNGNLKQFWGMNEQIGGLMGMYSAIFNAFFLPGFSEWFTLECLDFFSFL